MSDKSLTNDSYKDFYSTPSTDGVESTRGNSVCLSIITLSFFFWWFWPCKPYIFWKHITLATSTTKYRPVPPYTDPVTPRNNQCRPLLTKYQPVLPHTNPVQPNTNQCHLILTQYLQVPIRTNLNWLRTTKYKPLFERISTGRSLLINLT